jgi:hypothetical protein
MAAEKSTTMKSRTVSYPIDPDALKSVWHTDNGTTVTRHGNTSVGGSFGPITATGSGTYLGSNGAYGAVADWSNLAAVAPMTVNATGKIDLRGEAADITINGMSLKTTLEALQERLNWMQPNTELEAEWDQLRELGNRYRELEQQCQEKSQMWAKLKTLPKLNQL